MIRQGRLKSRFQLRHIQAVMLFKNLHCAHFMPPGNRLLYLRLAQNPDRGKVVSMHRPVSKDGRIFQIDLRLA